MDWHLLPLLILAYLLKNLDVNNISYIKVSLYSLILPS